eukprot:2863075-Pyramimonas_sp.AAC.1
MINRGRGSRAAIRKWCDKHPVSNAIPAMRWHVHACEAILKRVLPPAALLRFQRHLDLAPLL